MTDRNLLILPFGNRSTISDWITDANGRNFDVLLLYYHPEVTQPELRQASDAFGVRVLRDFKWWMIQDLFEQEPQLLQQYRYFYFPDDDIVMDKERINCIFHCFALSGAVLGQPALTRNSFKSWKALLRKPFSGIRYMNTVELMCPVMRNDALEMLLPTFKLTRSGYGIDLLWGEMIRKAYGVRSVCVIDTLPVFHSKPVGKGELYTKVGEPVFAERDRIFSDYRITDQTIHAMKLPENGLLGRWESFRKYRRYEKECRNSASVQG
ncbi:DUF707 domain-containing protein [Chitinophaga lutea]